MKARWVAVGVIAGALAMIAGGAFAASDAGTFNLSADSSLNVTCPNALSNTNEVAGSETVNCAATPTTTTPPTTSPPTTTPPPPPSGCPQFLEAPTAPIAFCDTLGRPDPTAGTRSGQLNGVLWGVSRATQSVNVGQGQLYVWPTSQQNQCGTTVPVQPDSDINMCGNELVESLNDNGGSATLGMYPRQPFDFAGRTGTVEFNVSADTDGGHSAWPAFVLTDQPVPAPGAGGSLTQAGLSDAARNSVGVAFEGAPGVSSGCTSAQIYATANYLEVPVTTNTDACVPISPTAQGTPSALNHVEIQISAQGVDVYMGDVNNPASTRLVADASFQVPLTRGLIWLTDAHYNACKPPNNQCDHTFGWSDVAFDGSVLPRDLGFDVPDASPTNLGYLIPGNGSSLTVSTTNPVTAANIAAASGALLVFNYFPCAQNQTFTVSMDGGAPVAMTMPTTTDSCSAQTIGIPVPLADIQPGVQTINIKTSDPNGVGSANYDLILVGAGG